MRFLMLYTSAQPNALPKPEQLEEMGKFTEQCFRSGVLVETGGLKPPSEGARVRYAAGQVTVLDGPFAESKEVVGGFAIVEMPSLAEAIELTRRFLRVAGEGVTEIRPLHSHEDFQ